MGAPIGSPPVLKAGAFDSVQTGTRTVKQVRWPRSRAPCPLWLGLVDVAELPVALPGEGDVVAGSSAVSFAPARLVSRRGFRRRSEASVGSRRVSPCVRGAQGSPCWTRRRTSSTIAEGLFWVLASREAGRGLVCDAAYTRTCGLFGNCLVRSWASGK